MRVLLQVVKECSVYVDGGLHSKIGRGYLLYVGFGEGDDFSILEAVAKKILALRLFKDDQGKTNLSLEEVAGSIMSVSQFTLYADPRKGNRPSFTSCLKYDEANKLYDTFNTILRELSMKDISTGVFGVDMEVSSINDGPFTLRLDSEELFR